MKGAEGSKPVFCLHRAFSFNKERRQLIKHIIPTNYGITTKFKAVKDHKENLAQNNVSQKACLISDIYVEP